MATILFTFSVHFVMPLTLNHNTIHHILSVIFAWAFEVRKFLQIKFPFMTN